MADSGTGNGSRPMPVIPKVGASGSRQGDTVKKYLPERPAGGVKGSGTMNHKVQGAGTSGR